MTEFIGEERYRHSTGYLQRALNTIPLGSQTFSKSMTQYPVGVSPLFIERGQGASVWDVDGNEYVDFISGLLSVLIGYCDPDVDQAVQKQMTSGVSFSLPHRLEMEVSELLVDTIPCAEMVRFGKNGTDSTSAAIRLARAFTGRDDVAVCGYHGWQDWYIGSTTRSMGVPAATQSLTHTFQYNNLESLQAIFDQHPKGIAAVMMEPMNVAYPNNQFLQQVKTLAHQHGALLIFDETITGFRFSRGGAQELFNVTPDLATFGKGMGNGYPISAVVGRRDVMKLMEDIFYSGTFAGETLSLAAAKAVIHKLHDGHLLENLHSNGRYLIDGLDKKIIEAGLQETLSVCGHPSWSFLTFKATKDHSDWQLKTLFLQEIFKLGFLTVGSHNLSCSHTREHIDQLLKAYGTVFKTLTKVHNGEPLKKYLSVEPLQPLFKVR